MIWWPWPFYLDFQYFVAAWSMASVSQTHLDVSQNCYNVFNAEQQNNIWPVLTFWIEVQFILDALYKGQNHAEELLEVRKSVATTIWNALAEQCHWETKRNQESRVNVYTLSHEHKVHLIYSWFLKMPVEAWFICTYLNDCNWDGRVNFKLWFIWSIDALIGLEIKFIWKGTRRRKLMTYWFAPEFSSGWYVTLFQVKCIILLYISILTLCYMIDCHIN